MKIYRTASGILLEENDTFYLIDKDWDIFINNDDLYRELHSALPGLAPTERSQEILNEELLPPIQSQEIWASGVTYYRSREARMEEAKDAGGGDFYDRVYFAERPELFFKSTPYRAVGHGQQVRIRKDSNWNVPEPELTLVVTSSGKIIGYTVGNDMSSRDIEGENPLYLPQAKSYDGSASIGPGILLREEPLSRDTAIALQISRQGNTVFEGDTTLDQMKRKPQVLVSFLYLETSFPHGALLMTGTGIVPPDDFTLASGDEIRIRIDQIGTLINTVA